MSSKLDYLQKYLGAGESLGGKKKVKKKKVKDPYSNLRVFDNDAIAPAKALMADDEEDQPMIVDMTKKVEKVIEAPRPKLAPNDGSGWVTVEDKKRSPSPPRRTRHDSDASPPRRARHDSDASPPRRKRHDSDASPPRRGRHDSDASPPRRGRRQDSDASPPRRGRHDSDASPPRRKRHDSDASPPRRGRHDSDASPPRRGRRQDSDASPPRRGRHDSDASPPRRKRHDSDPSPPSQAEHVQGGKKEVLMSSGARAGLSSGTELKEQILKKKREEDEKIMKMEKDLSGRGAGTVYRDKRGRKLDMLNQYMNQGKGNEEEDFEWGGGVKQAQDKLDELQRLEEEKNAPFARTKDDKRLNDMLKDRERWGDPMAHLVRKKKRKTEDDSSKYEDQKPRYKGSWPWNRFNIPPGHRWDGVDRSNGFEKTFATSKNEAGAWKEAAYKWSAEDM